MVQPVKASPLFEVFHGKNTIMSHDQLSSIYNNFRLIVASLGINLLIHAAMVAHYDKEIDLALAGSKMFSGEWTEYSEYAWIITSSVACVCGVMGIIAGAFHSASAAKALLLGWVFMALNQIVETSMVLFIAAHKPPSTQHLQTLILVEAVCIVLMEVIFVVAIMDFLKFNRWYKSTVAEEGYAPLLDTSELADEEAALNYYVSGEAARVV